MQQFGFEFVKNVPWENLELEPEPLYLPCILPLGLIGIGIVQGLSFHRTILPRYKKEDLAKRLFWLLENKDNLPKKPKSWKTKMTEDKYGPCIKPHKPDCDLEETENDFYKILMVGEGKVIYKPKVKVEEIEVERNKKKQKIKVVSINGKAPNATFEPMLKDYDSGKLPLINLPIDQSKKQDTCIYLEPKRGTNLDEFSELVSSKYLNKAVHFKCYTCNLNGVVNQTPIDELLLNCVNYWKEAYSSYLCSKIEGLSERCIENYICVFLRDCVLKKLNNLSDIISEWKKVSHEVNVFKPNKELRKVEIEKRTITEDEVKNIYGKTPIKRLVEFKQNQDAIKTELSNLQKDLINLDQKPIERLRELNFQ